MALHERFLISHKKEITDMTIIGHDFSSFGALLNTFRKRARFTQQALAEAIGVHRRTLVRWEQGDALPGSKALVLELARYLKLDDQKTRQLLDASLTALSPLSELSASSRQRYRSCGSVPFSTQKRSLKNCFWKARHTLGRNWQGWSAIFPNLTRPSPRYAACPCSSAILKHRHSQCIDWYRRS